MQGMAVHGTDLGMEYPLQNHALNDCFVLLGEPCLYLWQGGGEVQDWLWSHRGMGVANCRRTKQVA